MQLLVGTFGFFWLHTALWFYREWKDRRDGKTGTHVKLAALPPELQGKNVSTEGEAGLKGHVLATPQVIEGGVSVWAQYVIEHENRDGLAAYGYRCVEILHRNMHALDLPILTIALECGYGSIGPFNRAFRQRFGMTPTEYRAGTRLAQHLRQMRGELREILGVARAILELDIARARHLVKRKVLRAVHAERVHLRVTGETAMRTVALVHIEIDHRHPQRQ